MTSRPTRNRKTATSSNPETGRSGASRKEKLTRPRKKSRSSNATSTAITMETESRNGGRFALEVLPVDVRFYQTRSGEGLSHTYRLHPTQCLIAIEADQSMTMSVIFSGLNQSSFVN